MQVRDDGHVDRWQVCGIDARSHEATRKPTAHRLGKHGVGEDELIIDLQEHRRMADPKRREPHIGTGWVSHPAGNGSRSPDESNDISLEDTAKDAPPLKDQGNQAD